MDNNGKAFVKSVSKRKRQTSEDSDYKPIEESKGAAQRIWSKDDEIKLLESLRKLEKKDDMGELFGLVKVCLSFSPNRRQVVDKVRRMKAKFLDVVEGKNVVCPPDIYKLSQQLWGNKEADRLDDDGEDFEELDVDSVFLNKYPYMHRCIMSMYSHLKLGVGGCKEVKNNLMTSLMKDLPSKKLQEMENDWDRFYYVDLMHGHNRAKLVKKQLKLHERVYFGSKKKN